VAKFTWVFFLFFRLRLVDGPLGHSDSVARVWREQANSPPASCTPQRMTSPATHGFNTTSKGVIQLPRGAYLTTPFSRYSLPLRRPPFRYFFRWFPPQWFIYYQAVPTWSAAVHHPDSTFVPFRKLGFASPARGCTAWYFSCLWISFAPLCRALPRAEGGYSQFPNYVVF